MDLNRGDRFGLVLLHCHRRLCCRCLGSFVCLFSSSSSSSSDDDGDRPCLIFLLPSVAATAITAVVSMLWVTLARSFSFAVDQRFSPLVALPSRSRRFTFTAAASPPAPRPAPAALLAPLHAFTPADHPPFPTPAPNEATAPPLLSSSQRSLLLYLIAPSPTPTPALPSHPCSLRLRCPLRWQRPPPTHPPPSSSTLVEC